MCESKKKNNRNRLVRARSCARFNSIARAFGVQMICNSKKQKKTVITFSFENWQKNHFESSERMKYMLEVLINVYTGKLYLC